MKYHVASLKLTVQLWNSVAAGQFFSSFLASAFRKRKKGGLLLEADEKEEEKTQQNGEDQKEEEVDNAEQVERSREEEEKKKEDALWASFLSDVGQKPKAVAATQGTQIKKVTGAWACSQGVWEGPEGLEHASLVLAGICCWTQLGSGWGCPCPLSFVRLSSPDGPDCKVLISFQVQRWCCFWSYLSAAWSVLHSPVGFPFWSWIPLLTQE